MKINFNFVLFLISVSLSGCVTVNTYQVFHTTSEQLNDKYEFENNDLKVGYSLWFSGGQLQVTLTNKTDSPLFVDWFQTNFVINGYSYICYQEQQYQSSLSLSAGNTTAKMSPSGAVQFPSRSGSVSQSVTYKNSSLSFIPPHSKIVSTFFQGELARPINKCDLVLKDKENQTALTFTRENTPYAYRFYLGYSKHEDLTKMSFIDNAFWVQDVTLMTLQTFDGKSYDVKDCSGDIVGAYYKYPYKNPNSFYNGGSPVSNSKKKRSPAWVILGVAAVVVAIVLIVPGR